MNENKEISVEDIHLVIKRLSGYNGVFVPEFSFEDRRVDVAIIDTKKRWVRGFEIKVSRKDFLQDTKWTEYTKFCSSLSIVCPKGLIQPGEIQKPFGLLWVSPGARYPEREMEWKKRPKNFQKRDSLAWLWRYVEVIEREFSRMNYEIDCMRREAARRGVEYGKSNRQIQSEEKK